MSQFAINDGQPGSWEVLSYFLHRLEIARFRSVAGWSCVNHEVYTRSCGVVGVRFPCDTRPYSNLSFPAYFLEMDRPYQDGW